MRQNLLLPDYGKEVDRRWRKKGVNFGIRTG